MSDRDAGQPGGASAPDPDRERAFRLHLLGGVVFALIAGLSLGRMLFAPVDLFVHRILVFDELRTWVGVGGVFYGFSLVLLRFCPLRGGWAAGYAVASFGLLFVVCFPVAPVGAAGMMRRTANPESVVALGTMLAWVRIVQWIAAAGFVVVQAAYLRFAWVRQRVKG